ncbi:PREDICTED: phospholipase D4-like [Bison bison bison]|uniref:Phospholipase D4-like n=1 Tax=Bison bison bison TaxID=43346 RepID=A0A6P3INK0_BISBB|nr:PREDICTED: phospholipase D4-like [Bison bison bison]
MGAAREFLYASVMEYFPTTRFRHPASYWPVLDTALRVAAFSRGCACACWSAAGSTRTPGCSPSCGPCRHSATQRPTCPWT